MEEGRVPSREPPGQDYRFFKRLHHADNPEVSLLVPHHGESVFRKLSVIEAPSLKKLASLCIFFDFFIAILKTFEHFLVL